MFIAQNIQLMIDILQVIDCIIQFILRGSVFSTKVSQRTIYETAVRFKSWFLTIVYLLFCDPRIWSHDYMAVVQI